MMNDLDTLRPEIRDAVDSLDKSEGIDFAWLAVRAELLRFGRENDEWQTRCLRIQTERDKARAELAALKTRIDGSRHAFLGPNMDRITFLAEDIGPIGRYALVKVEE